ncbi:nitrite reductase small subunit NirD [Aeromicrobium fastidiosum]|uniref:Nitrite reductase small subunit NirD n=1 Tax=Aeromicrobium fastidiosum TaxID=52699 RepID=A0A641ANH2_9ACTN|nr:nitrite reductase small subunit NirD [Aeromicrobium fastidiosum]KAA1376474.1 nitrite reductase small subunit NirD [Aeromicrobium fastidiosum]MBP2391609.1 nitrite reductase (NADH) small subunit [Aeromicrobium fastidiosum]
MTTTTTTTWTRVCALDALVPDRGVAALVDGHQVAVFRLGGSGDVHAIDHHDPFSGANVMARGLVGSRQDVPTVASPMHKQSFDLTTGQCLDDADVTLRVWPTRVVDGWVEIGGGTA